MECETCKDLDHESKSKPPTDFKKIRVHFVYDVKNDGRYKTILEDDSYLTNILLSIVFSGVVPLKGITLVLFLV